MPDETLRRLVVAFGGAQFDCGEWDETNEDESFAEVMARAEQTEIELWAYLAARPPAPSDEPDNSLGNQLAALQARDFKRINDPRPHTCPEEAREADGEWSDEYWVLDQALMDAKELPRTDGFIAKLKAIRDRFDSRSAPPDQHQDAEPMVDAEQESMIQSYAMIPPLTLLPQTVRDASFLARLVLLQRARLRRPLEAPTDT